MREGAGLVAADPDKTFDYLIRHANLTELRALQGLLRTGSARQAAIATDIPITTLRAALRNISTRFRSQLKVELTVQDDHNQYMLTEQGVFVAERAGRVLSAYRELVESIASPAVALPIPCTYNCIRHLKHLREALPDDRNFDIRPHPVRTSELRRHGLRSPISLGSVLMDRAQSGLDDHTHVVRILSEEIELISHADLQLRSPVTVRAVLDAGVHLLVPDGGVVWEFLQHNYPGWHDIYLGQYTVVPHLGFGLVQLSEGMPTRGGMFVHNHAAVRMAFGHRQVWTYKLTEMDGLAHQAVTAVLYDRRGPNTTPQSDVIWRVANDLWQPAGTLFS